MSAVTARLLPPQTRIILGPAAFFQPSQYNEALLAGDTGIREANRAPMERLTQVFGPAYLDRVLRVDRPLLDPALGPPLDQSVDGRWMFGEGPALTLIDPSGRTIAVVLPDDWPGPSGSVMLSHVLVPGAPSAPRDARPRWREVHAVSWHDDLGGMGAGYAAALGGELISALGAAGDPTSLAVERLLGGHHVAHVPLRVAYQAADWTLLLSSGEYGDKLPVGFRGCHAALEPAALAARVTTADLRVVASLPNPLAAGVLQLPGAAVRFFAPAMRNMGDRDFPVSRFAEAVDVLSCNRREWETLADREEVAWRVSILAITDGPRGSCVRFTTPSGEPGMVTVPAFPRDEPPRDTNRAGEAYAATLLTTLLDGGWSPGVVEEPLVRHAAERAAAAAALVLDRLDFGFPDPRAIDAALRAGRIERAADGAR
jgi:ribokinase